jgi:hypothetical protein
LAVTVYEASGDPAEILSLTSAKTLQDHLLDRFVPAAAGQHVRAGNTDYGVADVERWLTVLARYLDNNTRTSRTVGGQLLSGTDLVLHRLWPLAGRRARIAGTTMAAGAGLLTAGTLWILLPIRAPTAQKFVLLGFVLLVGSLVLWQATITWPAPRGIEWRTLRTSGGRVAVAVSVGVGLSASVAAAFAIALLGAPWGGSLGLNVAGYLVLLLPVGLGIGLAVGLRINLDTSGAGGAAEGPRDLLRADRRTGQAAGLTAGLGIGVAAAVAGAVGVGFFSYGTIGSAVLMGAILAVVCGTVFAFSGGLLWAAAWRRYAAFLTCTRGRLPWRLGRFLDWAYDAGLLRISGTAYQFRHLELQDHLASGPATLKRNQSGPLLICGVSVLAPGFVIMVGFGDAGSGAAVV